MSKYTRPYTAFQFQQMIAPTLARVLIEVQDCLPGDIHVRECIEWEDPRVVSAFCKLVNLQPDDYARLQRSPRSLAEQNDVILRARDAREALWHADEVAQLDGQPALDFALGWMSALEWISHFQTCPHGTNCQGKSCPSGEEIETAIGNAQSVWFPVSPDDFQQGFKYLLNLRVGKPGQCDLQRDPSIVAFA